MVKCIRWFRRISTQGPWAWLKWQGFGRWNCRISLSTCVYLDNFFSWGSVSKYHVGGLDHPKTCLQLKLAKVGRRKDWTKFSYLTPIRGGMHTVGHTFVCQFLLFCNTILSDTHQPYKLHYQIHPLFVFSYIVLFL